MVGQSKICVRQRKYANDNRINEIELKTKKIEKDDCKKIDDVVIRIQHALLFTTNRKGEKDKNNNR